MLAALLLNLGEEDEFGGKQFPLKVYVDVPLVALERVVAETYKPPSTKKKKKKYNVEFTPLDKIEEVIDRAEDYPIPQLQEKRDQLISAISPEAATMFDRILDSMEEQAKEFQTLSSPIVREQVALLEEWMDEEDLLAVVINDARL